MSETRALETAVVGGRKCPIRRQGLLYRIMFDSVKDRFRSGEDFERSRKDVAQDVRSLIAGTLHAGRYAAALDQFNADEATYFVAMRIPNRVRPPVKIGISRAIIGRMEALRTSSPFPIELLVSVPSVLFDEGTVHGNFQREHLRGEWFTFGTRLARFVDELRAFNARQPA